MSKKVSYSASLVTQGEHRFYQLAMPSETLAKCSFVTTRDEDPDKGFQRMLDEKRAIEIAKYIDSGLGTIPTSIILSAQEIAELEYDSRNKTVDFILDSHSFLILDGQHRVFGFRKASTSVRVPVVIYSNLTRRDESKLFIDINSKQRGVPNELLLDIKRMADYESNEEELFRGIFDRLNNDPTSPLFDKMSPSKRSTNKISRVTFNSAMRIIYKIISSRTSEEIYEIVSNYIVVFRDGLIRVDGDDRKLVQSAPFKAIIAFFAPVASKVKDRFGPEYTVENFEHVLLPLFDRIKASKINGNSHTKILEYFEANLDTEFSL
jgi:DGQHR domain-containing protein